VVEVGFHHAELCRRECAIDVLIEAPERVFTGEAGGRSHERRTLGWVERFRVGGRLWAMGCSLLAMATGFSCDSLSSSPERA
jgi:hypothetical protein